MDSEFYVKEWEQCFEEGVQFAEVDDGDNEGYEPGEVIGDGGYEVKH